MYLRYSVWRATSFANASQDHLRKAKIKVKAGKEVGEMLAKDWQFDMGYGYIYIYTYM